MGDLQPVVMAPLTRCRATNPDLSPTDLHIRTTHNARHRASSSPATAMHDQATAHNGFGITSVDVRIAFRADHAGLHTVAARLMQQIHRRGVQAGPLVTPLHQRHIDRKQGTSLSCQSILAELTRGRRAIRATLENTVFDQPAETIGQNVTGQPDTALELLEPPGAVERLAQDRPYPSFANDRPGAGDRAILFEKFGMLHAYEDSRASRFVSKRENRPYVN